MAERGDAPEWATWSNLAYVPAWYVIWRHYDAYGEWAAFTRLVGMAALMLFSILHHACDYDPTGTCRLFRHMDHVTAMGGAVSLALVFLPLYGSWLGWLDLALQLLGFAGALFAVIFAGVDGPHTDMANGVVVAGTVFLGFVICWIALGSLRAFPRHSLIALVAHVVTRGTHTQRLALALGLASAVCAGVFWYVPAFATSDLYHGFWHLTTALTFVFIYPLLTQFHRTVYETSYATVPSS